MNIISSKILVTCAFPYANGSIHIGHMLEHIQADIWVRYHRMNNKKVIFICADDAHGTPIMLKAQKLDITPEKMIYKINMEHKEDLKKFGISYDMYHSTHSKENKKLLIKIYKKLKKKGFIKSRLISQLFDIEKKIFLPDRFIKGTCPKCFSKDQYGDNCELCGSTYNSIDIINPKSIISGTIPILKKTKHFFFDLPIFTQIQKKWINSGVIQNEVVNKINEWFKCGLQQWDISRDAPYFGFKIPGSKEKYFYVWLDATIGYMGCFKHLCKTRKDINFNEFWKNNSKTDLYHFIGKDIVYFHCLFWPAILHGINFRKPTKLFVHGYVTVNGSKMSKSRGTMIKAKTYLKYFDPDYLRYYYASKLSFKINDIDFNLDDFVQKVNTDIINKIINLAARNASFINKYFNNELSSNLCNPDLYKKYVKAKIYIDHAYSIRETNRVIKEIIILTDIANRYIDKQSPWLIPQKNYQNKKLQDICSMGLELFRIIIIYLKPIMPFLACRVENFLNTSLTWDKIESPMGFNRIKPFKSLLNRIKLEKIKSIFNNLNLK